MSGIVGQNTGRGSGLVKSGVVGADAVDSANIADDAIDSEHYTDGSIDNAHIADDAVDSDELAAGAVDTAHITDNQVTLAKMAGLARGKLIYGDSSGDPAALAVGSADEVLTHDGTDLAWAAAAGGMSVSDITGATALAEEPAIADEFVFSDAGTLKRVDYKHMAAAPGFMAYMNAAQTVANNSGTKGVFDLVRFSIGGTYDNSTNYRWTPGVAGWYLFWIHSEMNGSDDGEDMALIIMQNGTDVVRYGHGYRVMARTNHATDMQHQVVLYSDTNDYFEAKFYQGSGDDQDFNKDYSSFGAFRLGGMGIAAPTSGPPEN